MSFDWKENTLDELCLKITDGSHQSPKAFAGGKPMYSVKDMNEHGFNSEGVKTITDEDYIKLVKQGCKPEINDILIAKDGSVMKHVFKVEHDVVGVILSSIAILKPNLELVDPDFLVFSILNPIIKDNILCNYVSGSGVPRIVVKDFKKVSIRTPELQIQKQIARILVAKNKKIELNRQINQTLESISQAIFKSWFVDFDPVKAKIAALESGEDAEGVTRAAMRAISGKTNDELDKMEGGQPEDYAQLKTTAGLFPATMQDSELGEVPEGWEISTIGEEVGVVGGGTPSTKNPEFWDGGEIHWTTPKDLSNLTEKVLLTTERKITETGLKKVSSGLLPVNTVLMSSRAPVGYLALAKVPVAVNQGYIAMICEQCLSPEFVIQWCNSVMTDIKQRSSGTTFAEISKKNFKIIPVLVPSEEVQQSYSKLVSGFYDKITEIAIESLTLIDIRDFLLPKLLSGEVTIQGCVFE